MLLLSFPRFCPPPLCQHCQRCPPLSILPTFFNEICPKLLNLVIFDEIELFLEEKSLNLISFHDL